MVENSCGRVFHRSQSTISFRCVFECLTDRVNGRMRVASDDDLRQNGSIENVSVE